LRRKFLTRINNRKAIVAKVTELESINKKRKRAPRKTKKKHDTKRISKKLNAIISMETDSDVIMTEFYYIVHLPIKLSLFSYIIYY
jgi:ribosomal protein L9